MSTKKSKSSSASRQPPSGFANTAWESLWGFADDARIEVHRQTGALLGFAGGALEGLTAFASKQNDRIDDLAREGIVAANRGGRAVVHVTRETAKALRANYQKSTTQIVAGARDNVRNIADRASATARVMVAPLDEEDAA